MGQAQTPALVQVSDTLRNADGTAANGRLVISWEPFTSSDGATIDGGTLTYTILPRPGAPTSVTQAGASGSTTYYYWLSARNASGETLLGPSRVTTTSNATLSSTNYNTVAWNSLPGASDYRVWRTTTSTAPSGTGNYLVGVTTSTTINDQSNSLTSATVPAGNVNLSLAPNAGATPAGTSYRAQYFLANGASYTETWVVPATGPVEINDVRVSVVPSPTVTFNAGTQLTNIDFTAQSFTRPIKAGTMPPATCTANQDLFLDTDAAPGGQQLFLCNATGNGWNLVGDAGGAGSGITSLNGLQASSQTFATGTSGTDFGISSSGATHTFNLPDASATARGALSSADWSGFNSKENTLAFNAPLSRSVNTISIPQANETSNGFLASADWSAFNNKVTTTRAINTNAPLSGGGDLSADRTLSCATCELTTNKDQANGYAGLSALGKVGLTSVEELLGLSDLLDVAITTPAAGQVPRYNGSSWANAALAFSDLSGSATAGQVPNLENLNGTLDLASGGTNQTAWTAARCVRVNDVGTALEAFSSDCGSGGGNHNLLSNTHSDTVTASPVLGDLLYGNVTPAWTKLAGNITTTKQFLSQTGTGAVSAVPAWAQPAFADLSGTATDAQVPNNITIDLATTATTANAGDSATAFFSTGILESGIGGTGNGFTKFTGPTTSEKTFTLPDANATIEVQANKDAASGYAGLTASTKLNAAQGQEVWAVTDLSDVAITTPATAQTVRYNGSGWVNAALACTDVTNCPSLVAAGTNGIAGYNAGDDTTAARSDHTHRTFATTTWYFSGTPTSGVQNLTLALPEGIANPAITDMRVTVNTTSSGSSTFNIQRCTANCTGTGPTFANIYSANLTLNASTRTVAKAAAPDQNVTGLAAGDQFKANLVTVGASLADITITMTYKYETTN